MSKDSVWLPLKFDAYNDLEIAGKSFTEREFDVLAFILNSYNNKATAKYLGITEKGVRPHLRNIGGKIGSGYRDVIIEFVKKSNKLNILRENHYKQLVYHYHFFVKYVNELKKYTKKHELQCVIDFREDVDEKDEFLQNLKDDLKRLHVKAHIKNRPQNLRSERKTDPCIILTSSPKLISKTETTESLIIDLSSEKSYYHIVFDILNGIFNNKDVNSTVKKFCSDYKKLKKDPNSIQIPYNQTKKLNVVRFSLIGITLFTLLSLILFFSIDFNNTIHEHKSTIRSDLIIPGESYLLNRSDLLDKIEKQFNNSNRLQVLAIVGGGGSGKTTIARQYAKTQKSEIIWEMNAETKDTLKYSFDNLAQVLANTESDIKILKGIQKIRDQQKQEEQLINFVRDKLKQKSEWVLIYDNLENINTIEKYFPKDEETWGKGKVIVTTRDSNIGINRHIINVLQIGELSTSQKLTLFLKIYQNTQPPSESLTIEIKSFLEQIPPFPLDISIASNYLKETKISFEDYSKYLNQYNPDFEIMQTTLLKEIGDYSKTRCSSIIRSLDRVIEQNPDFKKLLLFISLIDSQNIPRNLLDKNNFLTDQFIHSLKKYSLITGESNSVLGPTISIHRSTQEISLMYLTKSLSLEKNPELIQSIGNAIESYIYRADVDTDFTKAMLIANHVEGFLKHSNLISDAIEGSLLSELGRLYTNAADYKNAINCLQKSLNLLKNSNSQYNLKIAQNLSYLGIIYRDLGDYLKAKSFLDQSIEYYKQYFPGNHFALARAYVALGYNYMDLGNHKHAIQLLKEGLSIYQQHYPKKHCWEAHAMMLLGTTYREIGDYEESTKLLQESIRILKEHCQESHITIARALANFGITKVWTENYNEAKKLLEECISILGRYLPETNISFELAFVYLGQTYCALGDYNKAKDYLDKSFAICEEHFGKNHVRTGWALKNLGDLALAQGQIETAHEFFMRALKIHINHPDSYLVLKSLAKLELAKSKNEKNNGNYILAQNFKNKAMDYLKEALEIVKKHFPESSSHEIKIYTELHSLMEKV